MTAVATPLPARRTGARPRRALLALAAVEGVHLLRHPLTLAGAALSVYLLWRSQRESVPVLHVVDARAAIMLVPLDLGALLAATLGAGRARRHRVEELYRSGPTRPWQRTAAHLLASVPVAALALALVCGQLLRLATADWAVGRPNPLEALVAPAIVALAVALGTAVATWLPPRTAVAAAPLLILAAAGTWATVYSGGDGQGIWLLPLVDPGVEAPAAMLLRPTGWHLLYLAGLTLVCCGAALARPARLAAAPVVAAGLAATLVGGVVQVRPPAPARVDAAWALATDPDTAHTCERRGTVRYCYLPGFGRWVGLWESAVAPVLAGLPPGAGRPELAVRQNVQGVTLSPPPLLETDSMVRPRPYPPHEVRTGTVWQRAHGGTRSAITLAADAAVEAIGIGPTEIEQPGPPVPASERYVEQAICHAPAVVALWLAARGNPAAADGLRRAVRDGDVRVERAGGQVTVFGGNRLYLDQFTRFPFSHRSAAYAVVLLDLPAERVRAAIWRHWAALTAPGAPRAELVGALGIRPLPTLPERLRALGVDAAAAEGFGRLDGTDDAAAQC